MTLNPIHKELTDLVPLLQASISPVTVISGVGLLVMSITNRYGRVLDRVRMMLRDYEAVFRAMKLEAPPGSEAPSPEWLKANDENPFLLEEMRILYLRANILRWSIIMALLCLFMVALTVGLLFSGLLFDINLVNYICGSFITSLVLLLLSIGFFVNDILLSLKTLRLDLEHFLPERWIVKS
jgi:Protein of unknown function (DUF2721)